MPVSYYSDYYKISQKKLYYKHSFLKKYLFIYLATSGLCYVIQDLLLQLMDTLVLIHVISSVAWRFRCSEACGILVPWPGIELKSSELKARVLTTEPPGKSPQIY